MTTPGNYTSASAGVGGASVALAVQAATPAAGFALTGGTPVIATWSVPNDGRLHRFTLTLAMDVTANTSGGSITVTFTLPDATAVTFTWINGTQAFTGFNFGVSNPGILPVRAGTTVTVAQATALTGGAATVWAEIWGS